MYDVKKHNGQKRIKIVFLKSTGCILGLDKMTVKMGLNYLNSLIAVFNEQKQS